MLSKIVSSSFFSVSYSSLITRPHQPHPPPPVGLGDPLLGPSAIDAVSMGCMYINPVHDTPVRGHFQTQHDYAMEQIGAPYVCNAHLSDVSSVQKCIALALKADLPPFIPPDFQHDAYVGRVKTIFGLA